MMTRNSILHTQLLLLTNGFHTVLQSQSNTHLLFLLLHPTTSFASGRSTLRTQLGHPQSLPHPFLLRPLQNEPCSVSLEVSSSPSFSHSQRVYCNLTNFCFTVIISVWELWVLDQSLVAKLGLRAFILLQWVVAAAALYQILLFM